MDCLPPALGGNRVKHAAMMLGHETASDGGIRWKAMTTSGPSAEKVTGDPDSSIRRR